jgi:hypothetical protein
LLWAVYLSAFLTYTFSSAELEGTLLRWEGSSGILSAVAWFLAFALGFWAWRKFKLRDATAVPFEAEMPEDQMFQGFNLTEMYAAQSVAPRANGSAKFPV